MTLFRKPKSVPSEFSIRVGGTSRPLTVPDEPSGERFIQATILLDCKSDFDAILNLAFIESVRSATEVGEKMVELRKFLRERVLDCYEARDGGKLREIYAAVFDGDFKGATSADFLALSDGQLTAGAFRFFLNALNCSLRV